MRCTKNTPCLPVFQFPYFLYSSGSVYNNFPRYSGLFGFTLFFHLLWLPCRLTNCVWTFFVQNKLWSSYLLYQQCIYLYSMQLCTSFSPDHQTNRTGQPKCETFDRHKLWYSVIMLCDVLPDVFVQKCPAVGHRQRRAVSDREYFTSFCAVEHTAEVHRSGGEVEVWVVDLSMQLHRVLLWMSQVMYLQ